MTIHISPEMEAQLNELAVQTGQTPEETAQSLLSERLAYDRWYRQEVAKGFASVERGDFYTHEEVEAMFASQLKN